MKIRRFIKKRRQRAAKRLANEMAAKELGAYDRRQLLAFERWLKGALVADPDDLLRRSVIEGPGY